MSTRDVTEFGAVYGLAPYGQTKRNVEAIREGMVWASETGGVLAFTGIVELPPRFESMIDELNAMGNVA